MARIRNRADHVAGAIPKCPDAFSCIFASQNCEGNQTFQPSLLEETQGSPYQTIKLSASFTTTRNGTQEGVKWLHGRRTSRPFFVWGLELVLEALFRSVFSKIEKSAEDRIHDANERDSFEMQPIIITGR